MILNGHYYPDWIWKNTIHKNEETGEYEGDAAMAIVEGNRQAGKTVGIGIYCIEDFFKYGYKCAYVARCENHINDTAILPVESFWLKAWRFVNSDKIRVPDIENHTITFKSHYVYIDDVLFCYPVVLAKSGRSKNADYDNVHKIIFDEYINEDTNPLPGELECIYRTYDTIARNRDDALDTTAFIFISNCVDKGSDLKDDLGVDEEVRRDTKRLNRGNEKGWIYEQVFNKIVADKYAKSAIAKCQKCGERGRAYSGYAQQNIFKNNTDFVIPKKPKGKESYLYNLTYNDMVYSVKYYERAGVIYISDDDVDKSYPVNYAMSKEDHTINTSLIINPDVKKKLDQLKLHFSAGILQFNSLNTKKMFLDVYKVL